MKKSLQPKSISPVVFAGPSGVGKSTLISRLMKEYPDSFGFSVSHTTRAPRPGEVNGINYHFVSNEEFDKVKAEDGFIENTIYAGNKYGTSKKAVADVALKNRLCILDVDIAGVKSLKNTDLQCRYFFLKPPSIEELRRRLVNRGETPENIEKRIKVAEGELPYADIGGFFDHIIVNNDLEKAYQDLEAAVLTL